METIIICTIFGVFIMLSFVLGVKIGQSVKNNEKVEIKSPIQAIREHKENKKYQEQRAYEEEVEQINLHNIDIYDGTELGQKTFPTRKE